MRTPESEQMTLTVRCPHCEADVTVVARIGSETRVLACTYFFKDRAAISMIDCDSCGEQFVISRKLAGNVKTVAMSLLGEERLT